MSDHRERLLDEVLASQLKAGGDEANNHVDLGFDEVPPHLVDPMLDYATDAVRSILPNPAFLLPVPNGAIGWAQELSLRFESRPRVVILDKIDNRNFVTTENAVEVARLLGRQLGVVIDDATTDGGTSEACADFARRELDVQVDGIVSILFRGKCYKPSRYSRSHAFRRHIPNQMSHGVFNATGQIVEQVE